MRIAAWLLVLGIAAGCQSMAPPEQKAEISGADAATSGTWVPVLAELGGQEYKLGQDFRLVVQGDRYEIAGAQRDSGRLIFYASNPKAFDVLGEVGPAQGLAIPAIYRFLPDGNMEICYDLSGTTRPTDFVTHPGTKLFRVVYKRR
ncbi:hypothetical protein BWI17_09380 [Betaproteobacteria bacterium GR16-43]|nr:hypothetical protein BWI17_09380 [Betaproteobacteria bacterium GR16-43]